MYEKITSGKKIPSYNWEAQGKLGTFEMSSEEFSKE